MARITLTGEEELSQLLESMPTALFEAAKEAVRESTLNLQRSLVGQFGNGGPLRRRTGSAARSIKTKVSGETLDAIKGEVYGRKTLAPYLAIHEEGGTIRARRAYRNLSGGPYLNIPIGDNLTAAGVMRKNAREVFEAGGFIVGDSSSGYVVLAADGSPMFTLKREVTIPARLGAKELAEEEVGTLMANLVHLLDQELDGA